MILPSILKHFTFKLERFLAMQGDTSIHVGIFVQDCEHRGLFFGVRGEGFQENGGVCNRRMTVILRNSRMIAFLVSILAKINQREG